MSAKEGGTKVGERDRLRIEWVRHSFAATAEKDESLLFLHESEAGSKAIYSTTSEISTNSAMEIAISDYAAPAV